jgi:hypothetical protein
MDWSPVYKVASLGFIIGIVFGAVVNKTNFCTMGAVSDWVNMGGYEIDACPCSSIKSFKLEIPD